MGRNPQPPSHKPQNNGKKSKGSVVMYVIYAVIIIALSSLLFGGESSGTSKKIAWSKLEPILVKHDYEKVVVVNQEFAEIYIKRDVLKRDSLTYKDLFGAPSLLGRPTEPGFYKYEFVNFEHFEKDLERVEEQTGERIDLTPERRANAWKEIMVWFGPLLIFVIFMLVMSAWSRKQMGGGSGSGGIFGVGKSRAKQYDGKTPNNVTFKDVAGLAGAKEEVMEVVVALQPSKSLLASVSMMALQLSRLS